MEAFIIYFESLLIKAILKSSMSVHVHVFAFVYYFVNELDMNSIVLE